MKFIVHLKSAHDQTGLSPYAVHKRTGIAINTIVKYTEADAVETGQLWPLVPRLADFYGVDWRDPEIVEFIYEEGDIVPESTTPLAQPA